MQTNTPDQNKPTNKKKTNTKTLVLSYFRDVITQNAGGGL